MAGGGGRRRWWSHTDGDLNYFNYQEKGPPIQLFCNELRTPTFGSVPSSTCVSHSTYYISIFESEKTIRRRPKRFFLLSFWFGERKTSVHLTGMRACMHALNEFESCNSATVQKGNDKTTAVIDSRPLKLRRNLG